LFHYHIMWTHNIWLVFSRVVAAIWQLTV